MSGIKARGLKQARGWLESIDKVRIPAAISDAITGETAKAKIESDAMRIMNKVVYSVYEPSRYQREFDLLASVVCESAQNGVVLGLNPSISPSKGNSDVSYGLYMTQAWAANSFLAATVPQTLPRPFDYAWASYFIDELPRKLAGAMKRRIK